MTPGQLRAARALIGIKVEELAEKAEVAANTISRFERGEGAMRRSTVAAIARALEAKGALMTPDGGVRPSIDQQAA